MNGYFGSLIYLMCSCTKNPDHNKCLFKGIRLHIFLSLCFVKVPPLTKHKLFGLKHTNKRGVEVTRLSLLHTHRRDRWEWWIKTERLPAWLCTEEEKNENTRCAVTEETKCAWNCDKKTRTATARVPLPPRRTSKVKTMKWALIVVASSSREPRNLSTLIDTKYTVLGDHFMVRKETAVHVVNRWRHSPARPKPMRLKWPF